MEIIETQDAPLPSAHYSQAIISQGLVFVSGLLPIVLNTKTLFQIAFQHRWIKSFII